MDSLPQKVEKLIADGSTTVFDDVIVPCEKLIIELVVEHCDGNYVQSSRLLGISRATLRKKLDQPRHFPRRPRGPQPESPGHASVQQSGQPMEPPSATETAG